MYSLQDQSNKQIEHKKSRNRHCISSQYLRSRIKIEQSQWDRQWRTSWPHRRAEAAGPRSSTARASAPSQLCREQIICRENGELRRPGRRNPGGLPRVLTGRTSFPLELRPRDAWLVRWISVDRLAEPRCGVQRATLYGMRGRVGVEMSK